MSTLEQDKKELRRRIKASLRSISDEEKARLSCLIMERLEKHPLFRQSQVVMLFHSLPDEPQTHSFIHRWSDKKQILLPVVINETDMVLRPYRGEQHLQSGSFSIGEPTGEDFTDLSRIDLAVVPGMAFDVAGHRMGRGRGYYDRFLSHPLLNSLPKIGICYSCQFFTAIPSEPHDVLMNEVITDK